MGGVDKAHVMLAGRPLIDHVAARLAPQVAALAVAANGDAGRFSSLGLPILPDAARRGPLAGVLSGMVWARALGALSVATAPVDGPFVPLDLVARLGPAPEVPHLVWAGGRHHPTYGVWPVALAPDLARFLDGGASPRLRDFAEHAGAVWVGFPDPAAFDNLNTAQDLAAAEARMKRGAQ